jgi:putative peptide zinc metalloprotease protein
MQSPLALAGDRRKQVKLRIRPDLDISQQRYEGKTCYVVKDPVSLRYYRFNEQEYFVVKMFDGKHTLEEAQKEFELNFRPQRLTHEDLEGFARQLLTAGLVQHESSRAAQELLVSRRKQRRMQRIATFTNILYIKIPIIDPDRILTWLLRRTWWIFTWWFFAASVALMLSAVVLVATHFTTFYDKLPEYHEFFAYNTLLYMWIALGIVKVIHEFGHGLSCKAFGGECHEMGALLMCLSPALYCNVSDSWTLPDKWKRIIISFAGIYVELVIAAIATWVWWYTPHRPFINHVSLCLMTLCSISTIVFNANPLMRFDGYYMLADWLEIPNLRDRSNRFLKNLFSEHALGIEVQPEPYMAFNRKVLFVIYAIASYLYRWIVTFSIIWTLSRFLKPYKLGTVSLLLAMAAIGSMFGWPIYRFFKNYNQRGRLPDMKRGRVTTTTLIFALLIAGFLFFPLPVSRVHQRGLVQIDKTALARVTLPNRAILERVYVTDGQTVKQGQILASFRSPELESKLADVVAQMKINREKASALRTQAQRVADPVERQKMESDAVGAESIARGKDDEKALYERRIERLRRLTSPIDGVIMSPPKVDEIGKMWEDFVERPVCLIGDRLRLAVLVPVEPYDHEWLRENMLSRGDDGYLAASVRIPGRGTKSWAGRVRRLPTSSASSVPVQLTFKCGGPLAVKPDANPNMFIPQSQQYLIEVEIDEVDRTVQPGVLANVIIHCRWRSGAWWAWRYINNTLDPGLI